MKKKLVITLFIFFTSIVIFADNAQDISLLKYNRLFNDGNYILLIEELEPAVDQFENGKGGIVTSSNIVHARNLIADSYRMLQKYYQAAQWYGETNDGYFDNYAKYCFLVLKNISIIKGREESIIKTEFQHYTGGAGSNPPHEGSFLIILGQLLNTRELFQKQTYLKEWASFDKNNDWVTRLTKFCAGDLTLDVLKTTVPKENFSTAFTYAGLSLEIFRNISEARELYTQVIFQKSDKIETLLAANRMGLLALQMIYTAFKDKGNLNTLTDIVAVKASSAKLEDTRLYSAKNLIDDDPATTWVPVGKNSQIGQWVELSFDDPVEINSLTLTNGFARNEVTFNNNNRIKTATLIFSDGNKIKVTLKDTMKPQLIEVNKRSRTVRIVIDEVYKGMKYDDTCLSGIEIDFKALNK